MKDTKPYLVLTHHFTIKNGKPVSLIQQHMRAFFSEEEQLPIDIPKGLSVEQALEQLKERKAKEDVPHRTQLEQEFEQSLDWVRVQLGESDALRLIEQDWIIVGATAFFAELEPSYEQVRDAIGEMVSQKSKVGI